MPPNQGFKEIDLENFFPKFRGDPVIIEGWIRQSNLDDLWRWWWLLSNCNNIAAVRFSQPGTSRFFTLSLFLLAYDGHVTSNFKRNEIGRQWSIGAVRFFEYSLGLEVGEFNIVEIENRTTADSSKCSVLIHNQRVVDQNGQDYGFLVLQ
ncbi:hypothetical protein BT96DRAFT_980118 [Gymnopus androsaceus JB14]|uniref:Uncharacterized protein n=1 Tax=Gymnopus androsaceus JB14 TaxID=1447944 RepID=A0A6A4GZF4_9AGAR|nr:hypothetical protein BT96DRAFT_980118 [Gymnopus androsaceus JB14]